MALSSERYETEGGRLESLKWDVDYLTGGDNVRAFIDLDDADDVRIIMGMLIPPQALIQAKGGLGSQAVAQTLGEMFWVSQYVRKQEIDQQLNDYYIAQLDRYNFGGQGPRARLVTSRFLKDDEAVVIDFLKLIVSRGDVAPRPPAQPTLDGGAGGAAAVAAVRGGRGGDARSLLAGAFARSAA